MNGTLIENIEKKVKALQKLLIEVATFKANIQEVNDVYKNIYEECSIDIEVAKIDYPELENDNRFSDLWAWQNFYSSSAELTQHAERCAYVFDMYDSFSRQLREIERKLGFLKVPQENENLIGIEQINSLIQEIDDISVCMVDVSTQSGQRFGDVIEQHDDSYRQHYENLSRRFLIFSNIGIHVEHQNNFSSLWQWYSFWKNEPLKTYAERRQYVESLYSETIRGLKTVVRSSQHGTLSCEQIKGLLKQKFQGQECITQQTQSTSRLPILEKGRDSDTNMKKEKDIELPIFSDDKETVVDFVIITALPIEREKVCGSLNFSQREKKGSRTYWRGKLKLADGSYYDIVVAQCTQAGNVSSNSSTVDVLKHWKPSGILMVGVAGAARATQNLGDVALGKAIVYYEFGKVMDGNYTAEPDVFKSDAMLWNHIDSLSEWTEDILTPRPDGQMLRPSINKGVIASGEKRISDAATRAKIAALDPKIIAIEMEGYGVSEAAWQSDIKCLVIRSICDMADSNEDNEWHSYAAEVAASYTKHFLLNCPLKPLSINAFVDFTEEEKRINRNDFMEGVELEYPLFLSLSSLLTKSGRTRSNARRSLCMVLHIDPSQLAFIEGTSDEDFSTQLLDHIYRTDNFDAALRLCQHLKKYLYRDNAKQLASIQVKIENHINARNN